MLSTALGRGTNSTMSEKSVCLTEVEVPSPITEEEWLHIAAGLLNNRLHKQARSLIDRFDALDPSTKHYNWIQLQWIQYYFWN